MPVKIPAPPEGYFTITQGSALHELPSAGQYRRDAEHRDPIPGVLVYAEGDWRPVVGLRARFRRSVDLDYCNSPLANEQTHGSYQQRVVPERIAVTREAIPQWLAMHERIEADRAAAEAARAERDRLRMETREEIKREERQTAEQARAEKLAAMTPETRRETLQHELVIAELLVESREEQVAEAQTQLDVARARLTAVQAELREASD